MQKTNLIGGAVLALTMACTSCNNCSQQSKNESKMEQKKENTTVLPTADKWVTSPVRHLLVLELEKPVAEVYALVGDPGNMPKYSVGLDSVTTKTENGKCIQYTCYFKPAAKGEKGYVHTDNMVWQAVNQGWAAKTPEPNEMGFTESFSLTTFEEINGKTIVKWYMHYNHKKPKMIEMNKQGLVSAFDDIGKQLVAKFGGKVVENYVEPSKH